MNVVAHAKFTFQTLTLNQYIYNNLQKHIHIQWYATSLWTVWIFNVYALTDPYVVVESLRHLLLHKVNRQFLHIIHDAVYNNL